MIEDLPYLQKIIFQNKETIKKEKHKYPFSIPFFKKNDEIIFHKNVTFLVGENGSGKSTLIEGIALGMGFSSEGGTRNFNIETTKNISPLHKYLKFHMSYLKPKDYYFLRAESFYNVATYMDETNYLEDYGGVSLHNQSHGESFLAVLKNKLKGNGLYIFDEPEAALSPQGQLQAIAAIHKLVGLNSQLIIATHSPIIMSYPNARILNIDENGLKEIKFEETEHFKTYNLFFNNRKELINRILHHIDS